MNKTKIMMAVAAFALAIGTMQADTVNRFIVGAYDKNDFSLVLDMFENNEKEGLAQFIEEGKGEIIQPGTTVTFLSLDGFLGGLVKVRPKGHSRGVWVPREYWTH
jgi:hypothetical protein